MCYSVMIENNLEKLEDIFHAKADMAAFQRYDSMVVRNSKKYKGIPDNPRIYPLYFAPIVVNNKGQNKIIPMRYRLRPNGSLNEVPTKYNLFNARLDSLQSRKTWKHLFTKNHGALCMRGFFEWVKDAEGQKKVIRFEASDDSYLITPVLYDIWVAENKSEAFASFAIITTDPTEEILTAGHDRAPITMSTSQTQSWLKANNAQKSLEILNNPKAIRYVHSKAES